MSSTQTKGRSALAERETNATSVPRRNTKETYIPPPVLPNSMSRGPSASNEVRRAPQPAPLRVHIQSGLVWLLRHPTTQNTAPPATTTKSKKRKSDGTADAAAPRAKKTKGDSPALDVSSVTSLPDAPNSDGRIPVYDSCNEVRRKIRAVLRKDGVTQAALLRALKAENPEGKAVSATSFQTFMNKTRPMALAGNTSIVYFTAYALFEKMRVRDGKPKTKHREMMENIWKKEGGVPLDQRQDYFTVRQGEHAYMDEYGRMTFE